MLVSKATSADASLIVQVVSTPAVAEHRHRLCGQPIEQQLPRGGTDRIVAARRYDPRDRLAMRRHDKSAPFADVTQQARESSIGVGGTHCGIHGMSLKVVNFTTNSRSRTDCQAPQCPLQRANASSASFSKERFKLARQP